MLGLSAELEKAINEAGREYAEAVEKSYRQPACRCGRVICRHKTCACRAQKQQEGQKERAE